MSVTPKNGPLITSFILRMDITLKEISNCHSNLRKKTEQNIQHSHVKKKNNQKVVCIKQTLNTISGLLSCSNAAIKLFNNGLSSAT